MVDSESTALPLGYSPKSAYNVTDLNPSIKSVMNRPIAELIEKLQSDQPYQQLEEVEHELKRTLLRLHTEGRDEEIIRITHQLGLLLKYKPYGVKCSTLLGYSIFLLNPREGFSFQRHTDFKTELFHCLANEPGDYAFIAESKDFESVASRSSIEKWWHDGAGDFSAFKKELRRGDVVKVERPGIVHTVIGATVEEFANTSVDLVERIFDQNKGRSTPILQRADVLQRIAALTSQPPICSYQLEAGTLACTDISPRAIGTHATAYQLHASPEFGAEIIAYDTGAHFDIDTTDSFISIFNFNGTVTLESPALSDGALVLRPAESVILPPAMHWSCTSESAGTFSLLTITKEKAFI